MRLSKVEKHVCSIVQLCSLGTALVRMLSYWGWIRGTRVSPAFLPRHKYRIGVVVGHWTGPHVKTKQWQETKSNKCAEICILRLMGWNGALGGLSRRRPAQPVPQLSGFRACTTRGIDCRSGRMRTSAHVSRSCWTRLAIVPLISMISRPPGRSTA